MRKVLAKNEGQRKLFRATWARVGKKRNYLGYSEDTILLTNVVDAASGEPVTDHVWFTFTKTFEKILVREGDTIEFEARVKEYSKGYVNKQYKINRQRKDFKLSHPTKVKVV